MSRLKLLLLGVGEPLNLPLPLHGLSAGGKGLRVDKPDHPVLMGVARSPPRPVGLKPLIQTGRVACVEAAVLTTQNIDIIALRLHQCLCLASLPRLKSIRFFRRFAI